MTTKKTMAELVEDLIHQVEMSDYWAGGINDSQHEGHVSKDHALKMNAAYLALKERRESFSEDHDRERTRIEQEQYNEYEFLSGAFRELIEAYHKALAALKKEPFSPGALIQRDATKHDIDTLSPIVQELGYNLMDMLQGKYQVELKFLKRPGPVKMNITKPILKT